MSQTSESKLQPFDVTTEGWELSWHFYGVLDQWNYIYDATLLRSFCSLRYNEDCDLSNKYPTVPCHNWLSDAVWSISGRNQSQKVHQLRIADSVHRQIADLICWTSLHDWYWYRKRREKILVWALGYDLCALVHFVCSK